MEHKEQLDDEIKDMAPMLSSIKKEDYDIPSDYFDRMQASVLEQVRLTPRDVPQPAIPWWKKMKPFTLPPVYRRGLAAVLSLSVLLLIYLQTTETKTTDNNLFVELSDEEIIEYIETNAEEIDLEYLEDLFVGQKEGTAELEQELILETLINELNQEEIEELL